MKNQNATDLKHLHKNKKRSLSFSNTCLCQPTANFTLAKLIAMLLFALIRKKKTHTHLLQKHVPRLPSFLLYSRCPLPKEASWRIHPPQAASMSLAGCSPSHLPSVLTAPRFTQHPPQRSHSHTQTPTWPCIQSAIYLCKTDMHMNTHTHLHQVN